MEDDSDSKNFRMINTHLGLFRCSYFPFGVKSASSMRNDVLTGLIGDAAYIDDIIVSGSNPEELPQLFTSALDRIQQYEFHLQTENSEFFRTSIK